MDKTDLLKYFTCPITKLIFCDPVLAEDGHLYEYMAIKNYFNKNTISPITGGRIGTLLIKATGFKKMVDEFVLTYPEYANDRFLFKKPFYLFTKDFLDLLREKKYDQLKEFTSIMLNTDIGKETLFSVICKICPDHIVKYVIDNSIDYDVYDRNKLKPLHTACKYATDDVIMYLAQKNVDLESEDMNGETPLGYLILYREDYKNIVSKFIELGVDVNKMNKSGMNPSHYIVANGDVDTLKVFVEHNLNIGTTSAKLGGVNVLQYAFKVSTMEVIKYLIELNINLDIDMDPKTPSEQLIYINQSLSRKEKQKLVLYYLTKLLNKPEVIEDYMASSVNDTNEVIEDFMSSSLNEGN